jgi:hypothetical protein
MLSVSTQSHPLSPSASPARFIPITVATVWLDQHILGDGGHVLLTSGHVDGKKSNVMEWGIGPLTVSTCFMRVLSIHVQSDIIRSPLPQVRISIDLPTKTASFDVFVTVPLVGKVRVGSVQGSIGNETGIKVDFDTKFAKGTARLFTKDEFLCLEVKVEVGTWNVDKTLRLFLLP